jgi:hypothetical protein
LVPVEIKPEEEKKEASPEKEEKKEKELTYEQLQLKKDTFIMQNYHYNKIQSLLMLIYILFILMESTDFMFFSVRNLTHMSPSSYFLTDRSTYSFIISLLILISINLFVAYLF